MTSQALIKKYVPSIPQAIRSLVAMERQLDSAKTYEHIRRIIKEAEAIKLLLGHVAEVKAKAEDAVLIGNRRIAEELRKVPKANARRRISPEGKSSAGRAATGIKPTSRHRLGKLADLSKDEVKATAARLREQGKDATVTAVVREITQGDKKERRAGRERELGAKTLALPDKKYNVIVEDFESDFKVRSRETGMDRHAANHYPVADAHTAPEIVKHTEDRFRCAADDCVLFMWTTVPLLDVGIDVLRLRGFKYVSNYTWGKDKVGTGYWNRNKHEHLLIGVKGSIPCPAPGTQWDSLIMAPVGEHSAKPECFLEMVEQYFPTLPKIELNRRGPPRPTWDAWGNEAQPAEAAE